jgi:hypothetical protein
MCKLFGKPYLNYLKIKYDIHNKYESDIPIETWCKNNGNVPMNFLSKLEKMELTLVKPVLLLCRPMEEN